MDSERLYGQIDFMMRSINEYGQFEEDRSYLLNDPKCNLGYIPYVMTPDLFSNFCKSNHYFNEFDTKRVADKLYPSTMPIFHIMSEFGLQFMSMQIKENDTSYITYTPNYVDFMKRCNYIVSYLMAYMECRYNELTPNLMASNLLISSNDNQSDDETQTNEKNNLDSLNEINEPVVIDFNRPIKLNFNDIDDDLPVVNVNDYLAKIDKSVIASKIKSPIKKQQINPGKININESIEIEISKLDINSVCSIKTDGFENDTLIKLGAFYLGGSCIKYKNDGNCRLGNKCRFYLSHGVSDYIDKLSNINNKFKRFTNTNSNDYIKFKNNQLAALIIDMIRCDFGSTDCDGNDIKYNNIFVTLSKYESWYEWLLTFDHSINNDDYSYKFKLIVPINAKSYNIIDLKVDYEVECNYNEYDNILDMNIRSDGLPDIIVGYVGQKQNNRKNIYNCIQSDDRAEEFFQKNVAKTRAALCIMAIKILEN